MPASVSPGDQLPPLLLCQMASSGLAFRQIKLPGDLQELMEQPVVLAVTVLVGLTLLLLLFKSRAGGSTQAKGTAAAGDSIWLWHITAAAGRGSCRLGGAWGKGSCPPVLPTVPLTRWGLPAPHLPAHVCHCPFSLHVNLLYNRRQAQAQQLHPGRGGGAQD